MPSKNLVLHSYVVKNKSSGLRNVLMLSSVQPLLGVTKDDNKFKPAIYKHYDFTKGGTDIVDQRVGFTPVSQSRLDGQWWHSFSFWTHAG